VLYSVFRNIRHNLSESHRKRLPPSTTRRTRPYAVVPQREALHSTAVHICIILLLKQLRSQDRHVSIFEQAIILSRLLCALPAWSPFVTVELLNNIDAFSLQRSHCYGFANSTKILCVLNSTYGKLFKNAICWLLANYPRLTRAVYSGPGVMIFSCPDVHSIYIKGLLVVTVSISLLLPSARICFLAFV